MCLKLYSTLRFKVRENKNQITRVKIFSSDGDIFPQL